MVLETITSKSQKLTSCNPLQDQVVTSKQFVTTSMAKKGAPIWSRNGEWLTESSDQKLRLMLTEKPQTFVAIRDEKRTHFLERLKDRFTHVEAFYVQDEGHFQYVSLNLASLCKRTHLSLATLFFRKITGRLSLDFIQHYAKLAEQQHQFYEKIVQNGRAQAVKVGQNPDQKVAELRDVIQSALKSLRLVAGVVAKKGSVTYLAHSDEQLPLSLKEKRELLGEGSYGTVFEAFDFGSGQLQALKVAKGTDVDGGGIFNEHALLHKIHAAHKDGHVAGVQDAPECTLDCPGMGEMYVTTKYDYNLTDPNFLLTMPLKRKLVKSQTLFQGLDWLHEHEIVHGDIKPANCCMDKGELQLADFGHAREHKEVTPDKPISVCTPYFTSEKDRNERKRIALDYYMHQLASGKIENPIERACILQSAIEFTPFKIDRKAAKLTVASILMKIRKEKLDAFNITTELYQKEIALLKNPPKGFAHSKLDLSDYQLDKTQLRQLQIDSVALCRGHDVFGLGITILCILLGVSYIEPNEIEIALKKLSKSSRLKEVNPELYELIAQMMDPEPSKRPTSKAARERYDKMLSKIDVAAYLA